MGLPRAVKALGVVSLLNDVASEMIYPLLPAFLSGVLKAGPAFLGLLEGLAEALAALLKVASGRISDRLTQRKPLVVAGYALSAAVRPWIAVAEAPAHVLVVRLCDRAGKGVRSAPRDALLAAATPAGERGRAYGFHRAMDHAGAMLGPLLAAAMLALGGELRLVFALAAVPGILAVLALVFGVDERHEPAGAGSRPAPASTGPAAAAVSGRPLRTYLGVLALFTLGNSSDAFLLLRAQDAGLSLAALPLLWALHHLVKAAASTHAGALSDRMGRKRAIVAGWLVYAACYAGFALATSAWQVWALFAAYGAFHALTEGPEKALVADMSAPAARGAAFGWYHGLTGAMLLPASVLTGGLWQAFGPATALLTGAGLACAASVLLWAWVPDTTPGTAAPPRGPVAGKGLTK